MNARKDLSLIECAGLMIRAHDNLEQRYLMEGSGECREACRAAIRMLGLMGGHQIMTPYLARVASCLEGLALAGFCRAEYREEKIIGALKRMAQLQNVLVDDAVGKLEPNAAAIVRHLISRYGADNVSMEEGLL